MNNQELRRIMAERKISVGTMCNLLKMSRSAFYRKTHGKSEFTLTEISSIIAILKLDSPAGIFFSSKVS